MASGSEFRVGVLGCGAIGSVVAQQIAAGKIPGAELAGVVVRHQRADIPYRQLSIDEAIEHCDLIVECAGQEALREHAVKVLESGVDLLVSSMGALADRVFEAKLRQAGPGRLLFTAGAIGGLDLLGAGAKMGSGFEEIQVTTRKLPQTLIQPWMNEVQRRELETAEAPMEVFAGTAAEAAQKFPKSLNVAAAVALAVEDWDVVSVRLLGDPQAVLTEHQIRARGASGEYSFTIKNYPSENNPRTSGIVPWALLHSLRQAVRSSGL
ncbi:aspartate dehydrogenase domain-containing protein [Glutamicibacter uratoxydans]|uniref:aspartate dehydrogenase domain-containing protein n=1 Tax=Glutamicibacter uratoxydans TaxID=43667 RepID=UPI001143F1BC|nr:aspartate dehydrogenase domain-containing protein [Glutamicibacter uratoxydans]